MRGTCASGSGRSAALVLAVALCACGEAGSGSPATEAGADDAPVAPAPTWPEGTVLAVDALPIRPEDVDPIVDAIAAAYPEYTRVHARRLALTNVVLPVWASRARHPAERELARRRAEASARALAAGERLEGVQPWRQELELDGHLASIDFDLWLAARRLDVGTWSEPIELVGRWAVVLVEAREEGPSPAATRFLLRVHRFPFVGTERDYYLDAQDALDAAVEACRLTLVDPVWGEAVPETWRRRMSGS